VDELAGGKLRLDEPAPHVARLTIDNPAKRNALDHDVLDALAEVLPRLTARCLLVTATGKVFSSGYDIGALPQERAPGAGAQPDAPAATEPAPPAGTGKRPASPAVTEPAPPAGTGKRPASPAGTEPASPAGFAAAAEAIVAHPFTAAIDALDAYPYPVLAAVGGHAIGGGLELALSCDLRICSADARLGMPPARLGLVYSHTGLRKFIDAIGAPRTRELFFTARYVGAEEALAWGLVGEILPAAEVAARGVELAAEIAANAPLSLAGNKRVIRALVAAKLDPGAEAELIALRDACFRSEDFFEGVRAFAEKRSPRWRGR